MELDYHRGPKEYGVCLFVTAVRSNRNGPKCKSRGMGERRFLSIINSITESPAGQSVGWRVKYWLVIIGTFVDETAWRKLWPRGGKTTVEQGFIS